MYHSDTPNPRRAGRKMLMLMVIFLLVGGGIPAWLWSVAGPDGSGSLVTQSPAMMISVVCGGLVLLGLVLGFVGLILTVKPAAH
jgi:hypothetical protein